MDINEAIEILEDWIRCEKILAERREPGNDYDKFCKGRAAAIEVVLEGLDSAYEQGFNDGANAAASDILLNGGNFYERKRYTE